MTNHGAARLLFATLLLALLGLAGAPPAQADDAKDNAPVWRNEPLLQKRFVEACDAVEKVTGVPYETRPTLKLSTRSDLREILRRELEPQLEATGQADQLDTSVRMMARMLLAKYEPGAHVVHLVPSRFENKRMPLLGDTSRIDEDFMRVLLAHEATHAQDWPRFDLSTRLATIADAEALQAFDAVIEGHAQYVEKRVAALWGIEQAFDTMTEAILYVPEVDEPLVQMIVEAMQAALTFSYVQGHAFVEAVAEARGEKGIAALLKDPPTKTRQIEQPAEYLDPSTAAAMPDLSEALGAFRFLIGDEAWASQESRILQGMLEAVRPTVPEAHREAFLEGYVDGRALIGQIPAESRQVIAMLLVFDTPEHASQFGRHERIVQEARDEAGGIEGVAMITSTEYEDGAGSENAVEGFLARKVVKTRGGDVHVATHTFVLGRIVGQIMRTNTPEIERRFEDGAVERLGRYLEDPARSRRTDAFNIGPVLLKKQVEALRLEVQDDEGRSVPRAKVLYRAAGMVKKGVVRDGTVVLSIPTDLGSIEVLVFEARTEDGRLLNLRPFYREEVEFSAALTVKLETGIMLRGRVVDEEGRPAVGFELSLEDASAFNDVLSIGSGSRLELPPLTGIRYDEDGTYELVGLAETRIITSGQDDADAREVQRYELVVKVPAGRLPVDPIPFTVEDGAPEVRILPDDRITVRVLDPIGKPLHEGTVVVTEGRNVTFHSLGAALAYRSGTVRIARPRGVATIEARVLRSPSGGTPSLISPKVEVGPGTKKVTIQMRPASTLRGRVIDRDGEPVSGVTVLAERPGEDGLLAIAFRHARTDADGRFEILGVEPGVYRLRMRKDEFGDLGEYAARTGVENEIVVVRDPAAASK